MKRKRFSLEQIVAVLKQAEVGSCGGADPPGWDHGTNPLSMEKTLQGLESDQVRQFKQLQEEDGQLKRLVAELTLDKVMLQDVLTKKL